MRTDGGPFRASGTDGSIKNRVASTGDVTVQTMFLNIILKIHKEIPFLLNLAASLPRCLQLTAVAAARHRLHRRPQSSP